MGTPAPDRLGLLLQLLSTLSDDGSSDELLRRVADAVRRFAGCDEVSLLWRTRGETRCLSSTASPAEAPPVGVCCPRIADEGCLCAAAMAEQEIRTGDGPPPEGSCLSSAWRSWALVPLTSHGRTTALLRLGDRRPGGLNDQALLALHEAAGGIAAVISGLRQREELSRSYDKVDALHRFALNLARTEDRQRIYELTVEALESVLEYTISLISVYRDGYLEAGAISSGTPEGGVRRFSVGEGIVGKTYRTQQTYYGADARTDPDAAPASNLYRSFISTPVGRHGVLQVVSTRVGSFDTGDVKLVELVARHAEEALNRIDLLERLKYEAIHDSLTGLHNRRYFNESLEAMVANARRYGYRLCFLLFDLNGFKRVNDAHGHLVGDEVLKAFAGSLRQVARRGDVLIRLGGDEFLMIYRSSDAPGSARSIVQRLQRTFQEAVRGLIQTEVTVAAGWSYLDPDDDVGAVDALSLADRQMYRAKASMGPSPR